MNKNKLSTYTSTYTHLSVFVIVFHPVLRVWDHGLIGILRPWHNYCKPYVVFIYSVVVREWIIWIHLKRDVIWFLIHVRPFILNTNKTNIIRGTRFMKITTLCSTILQIRKHSKVNSLIIVFILSYLNQDFVFCTYLYLKFFLSCQGWIAIDKLEIEPRKMY